MVSTLSSGNAYNLSKSTLKYNRCKSSGLLRIADGGPTFPTINQNTLYGTPHQLAEYGAGFWNNVSFVTASIPMWNQPV